MADAENIIHLLRQELPLDVYKMITEIDYHTSEDSFGFQGECFDQEDNLIKCMSYSDELGFELQPLMISWHTRLLGSDEKWNRVRISTFSDGQNEVVSWWDDSLR